MRAAVVTPGKKCSVRAVHMARPAEESGARYANSKEERMKSLPGKSGAFDIIIEATGAAKLATTAKELVNRTGVVCLLGPYPGTKEESVCTGCIDIELSSITRLISGR
jgi:threonine dehydrogenase-like Zn-dependent dehydrogenase